MWTPQPGPKRRPGGQELERRAPPHRGRLHRVRTVACQGQILHSNEWCPQSFSPSERAASFSRRLTMCVLFLNYCSSQRIPSHDCFANAAQQTSHPPVAMLTEYNSPIQSLATKCFSTAACRHPCLSSPSKASNARSHLDFWQPHMT